MLKTCHNFLNDYGRSLATRDSTPPSAISSEQQLKEQPQPISSTASTNLPTPTSGRTPPVPAPRHSLLSNGRPRQVSPALSREDEQLLAAAQGKSFWESQATQEPVFDKIDNINPEVFDSKIIRTRSSR